MSFEPTLESVGTHVVPDWFHDAKLGIFIHWGLYSVPAWAPPTGELGKVDWAIWFVVLWAIVSALSTALFRPAEQSYWAGVVPDRERAQVFSASSALMALVALPAGPLAGATYTLWPRGPFWLAIGLQLVTLGLILSLGNKESEREI